MCRSLVKRKSAPCLMSSNGSGFSGVAVGFCDILLLRSFGKGAAAKDCLNYFLGFNRGGF
jgi:hypothetical protein